MSLIQNSIANYSVKVSVVIPVYNKEKYLKECIESVLSQTYPNVEVVAVNDGSTDESHSILEYYASCHNGFYIVNQANKGLSVARNVGLDTCKGQYVLFHDADDILKSSAITDLLQAALDYQSDVVGGVFERDNGKLIKKFYHNDIKIDFSSNESLAVKYATNFSSCNKLFCVDFLNKNKLKFTAGLYMQDIEFWLKVMFASKNISQVKSVVSVYRDVLGSSSKAATPERFKSLFDLFDNLTEIKYEKNNKICSLILDIAYMQGAVIFFARWKLVEYIEKSNVDDINKICQILNLIPESSFLNYLNYADNGRAIFLMLLRNKMYLEAYKLSLNFSLIKKPASKFLNHQVQSITRNSTLLIKNIKIFIFCGPLVFGKGGMEKVASELANFLVEYGFKVSIGYFARGRQEPSYPLREEVLHIPWNRKKENIQCYKNKIKKLNFDTAISFTASCQVIQILSLFYDTDTPLIVHEGSNPERIIRDNWAVPRNISYFNASIEREAVLSAVSRIRMTLQEHTSNLPSFIKGKTQAFANAFTIPHKYESNVNNKNNIKRIINIGGMKPNKNIIPLIDAFSLLKNKYPSWQVVVFSARYKSKEAVSYMREVENRIKNLGLSDVFLIRDEVDDLDKEYNLSDIHVITSLSEGFGNCVAESMTHGVPSIGYSSCPGVRSLIQNEINGLLISEDLDSLVNALDLLMGESNLRKKLGVNAKRIANVDFNPNVIYQNWLDLIYNAVESEQKWFTNLDQNIVSKYKPLVEMLIKEELVEERDRTYSIAIFGAGNLFNVGGLQRSYQILTEHLVKSGHNVTLYSWLQKGKCEKVVNSELAYPIDDNVKVELVPQKADLSNFKLIENKLLENNPDIVVIVNSSQMSFFLAMVCAKNNIPYIQSLRGSSRYCLKYLWPCKFMMDAVFYGAVKCHLLMPSYTDIFSNEIKNKITVIPSQIEPSSCLADVENSNPNGRFVILYSGRFSFEKRVDYLIRAFSLLKNEYMSWDLWLYGNGPLEGEYKKLVEQLAIQDRVIFGNTNNTDEMYKLYPYADIKVLPSEQEGCPMALREAMMHGIPVIAYSECSGSNEIIDHEKNGLLVDYIREKKGDAIDKLYEALKKLIDNPEIRVKIGMNAHNKAKEYNPLLINSQWENLIVQGIEISKNDTFSENSYAFKEFSEYCYERNRFKDIFVFERNEFDLKRNIRDYLSLYEKDLFDRKYYLECYVDVKISGVDPLLHYIVKGWLCGYNPSPYFDNDAYIQKYKCNICPLVHFYSNDSDHDFKLELHDTAFISRNPKNSIK